jgi:hypothetical protein
VAKYGSKDEAMEEIKYLKQSPTGRGRHVANHTTSVLSTRRLPTFIECLTVIKINYKDDEEGYLQELNYLNNLKQNHPDARLLYGLSARRSGYRLHKLSACQILISKELPWSSDGYLPLFIFNLAVLQSHDLFDNRLKPSIVAGGQKWDFKMTTEDGSEEHLSFLPLYTSPAPGRMTWAAVGFVKNSEEFEPRALRVSWVDVMKRHSEQESYLRAHGQDPIPGLVRLLAAEVLDDRELIRASAVDPNRTIRRTKEAVILDNIGEPLSQCNSVLELLKVIYDTIHSTLTSILSEFRANDM